MPKHVAQALAGFVFGILGRIRYDRQAPRDKGRGRQFDVETRHKNIPP